MTSPGPLVSFAVLLDFGQHSLPTMTLPPQWEPRNPAFEKVVRESFARQTLMTTLGATITHLAPGTVQLSAPYAPQFAQQNGFWHAGAIASLADSANGYAAFTLAPAGTDVLAVEFKINLLAPARGESFLATGRVLRPGRTLSVCLAEVFALAGRSQSLIATMLSTIIIRGSSTGAPTG
jgi:uncharacterized protein (TIGR00369 family)